MEAQIKRLGEFLSFMGVGSIKNINYNIIGLFDFFTFYSIGNHPKGNLHNHEMDEPLHPRQRALIYHNSNQEK